MRGRQSTRHNKCSVRCVRCADFGAALLLDGVAGAAAAADCGGGAAADAIATAGLDGVAVGAAAAAGGIL